MLQLSPQLEPTPAGVCLTLCWTFSILKFMSYNVNCPLRGGHWIFWIDWQHNCDSRGWAFFIFTSAGFLEARQDSMANRHQYDAFHVNRTKINQKFAFQHPKVLGRTAEISLELQLTRTRKLGKPAGNTAYLDAGSRQVEWMSQESAYCDGSWPGALRWLICGLSPQDLPWRWPRQN